MPQVVFGSDNNKNKKQKTTKDHIILGVISKGRFAPTSAKTDNRSNKTKARRKFFTLPWNAQIRLSSRDLVYQELFHYFTLRSLLT